MTDDNHSTTAGSNMVVVEAHSLTREAIIEALKNGRFHAVNTHAITVENIRWDGRTLSLEASGTPEAPVEAVEFVGENGERLATVAGGRARFTLPDGGLYVRARIRGAGGGLALTQPFFPDPSKMSEQ